MKLDPDIKRCRAERRKRAKKLDPPMREAKRLLDASRDAWQEQRRRGRERAAEARRVR